MNKNNFAPGFSSNNKNNLGLILKSNGKRNTRLGAEIYSLFCHNKTPLTANDIHGKINTKADISSIYRTLKKFLDIKLICNETMGKENYYFLAGKHHHHIVCQQCGYIECIPCKTDFSWIPNFTNVSHKLILGGLCHECSRELPN